MKKEKYPDEFEDICSWVEEKVAKEKYKLQLDVLEIKQTQMFFAGILLLLLFVIAIATSDILKIVLWIALLIAFIIAAIYTIISSREMRKKNDVVKVDVLNEFAVHLKDVFVYDENGEVSESNYRKSGFDKSYTNFSSKCYMEGDRNGRKIGIGNISIKKHKINTKHIQLQGFKGIFMYSSLKREVNEIDVMKVNSKNNKKEKMEIVGENLFMYAESIEEAKKIINPEVVEEISKIKKEFKTTLELMVEGKMLYIRLFMDDINNEYLFDIISEKEILYKYYRLIKFIENIAQKIENNVVYSNKTKLK